MAKTKVSEWSSTAASNTDIDSINIAEGCAPSGINDAIRELMSQIKDFQAGTAGDSFNGPVGTTTAAAGAFTTLSASSTVTLSGGTANGVAYLNGSKVLTTGSALTFDGTQLSVGGGTGLFRLNASSSDYSLFKLAVSGTNYANIGVGTSGELVMNGNSLQIWQVGGSEQMRLTSTGLGIGTSSPGVRVDASGQVRALEAGTGSGGGGLIGSTASADGNAGVLFQTNSASRWNLTTAGTAGANLRVYNYALGSTVATFDSSGNLGLGVTPSAWSGGGQIDMGSDKFISSSDQYLSIGTNVYYNGGYKYKGTGAATFLYQSAGQFRFYTAPSGTAGNAISFTQAMTLDASGNLGVGTTSPANLLHVNGSNSVARFSGTSTALSAYQTFFNNSAAQAYFGIESSSGTGIIGTGSAYGMVLATASTNPLCFGTNGTERARIDSSGRLGINTTSPAALLDIRNTYGNGGGIVRLGTTGDGIVIDGALGSVDFFNSDSDANKVAAQVAGKSGGLYGGGGYLTFSSSVFGGSLTERARIDESGNLLVGTTSNSLGGRVASNGVGSSGGTCFSATGYGDGIGYAIRCQQSTTNAVPVQFLNSGGTQIGTISTTNTATAYNTSSDYRLKNSIAPMTGALAKVALLKPVTYKWKADGSDGEGFIAHELAEVVPQCVTGEKDAVDAEGNPVYQGIDTSFLVATLTAAIQELNAKFEAYKATHP